ncbi:MAG: BMP family ABC transporter substrate-binding protein [Ruminiclostridium sp.]|nr:BMP family ABC transporter substrate-binding protein [Ruminiclostridium sp.]
MIKNKKWISAILAGVMLLSFSSCNNEGEEEVTDDPAATAATDESGNPVTDESGNMVPAEPVEEKVYKVGFLYNNEVSDGATATIFENARDQLEKTLAVETCFIENVLVSDIPAAVRELQDNGCNIIVSCSSKFANSIAKEAQSSADTYYISFGGDSSGPTYSSFGGELYQTANVCGIAAAYNSTSNTLGIVADPSCYNVYGVVNSYVLGAKEIMAAQTDVRLNWVWSDDEAKVEAAVDDLVTQGCDVIMCYTESDTAVKYCEEIGVKVIANSCNIPEIAPENYLTGFFFNASTFIVDTVRAIKADNYVSSVHSGGIAAGTARLIDFSDNCREGTATIGTKLYEYVKSGQAHVFTGEIKNRDYKVMVESGQKMDFSSIREIDWLILGINSVGSYTTVIESPTPSDMVIKS